MSYLPRIAAGLLCALSVLLSASCTEKSAGTAKSSGGAEKSGVLVLAGGTFGRESGATDLLAREYGLAEEKGRVRILYWPETFELADASLRLLSNTAAEEEPEIILTVSAPEGTLRELRRIREASPSVKIVSIFPQDETIPVEAVSDITIDMFVPETDGGIEPQAEAETSLHVSGPQLSVLLLGAVLAAEHDGTDSLKAGELRAAMEEAADVASGAGYRNETETWEYIQAVDADTGLRSKNRVLIIQKGKTDRIAVRS